MSKDDQIMELKPFIDMLYKKYGKKKKLHKDSPSDSPSDLMLIEFTASDGKKWRGYAVCIEDKEQET